MTDPDAEQKIIRMVSDAMAGDIWILSILATSLCLLVGCARDKLGDPVLRSIEKHGVALFLQTAITFIPTLLGLLYGVPLAQRPTDKYPGYTFCGILFSQVSLEADLAGFYYRTVLIR